MENSTFIFFNVKPIKHLMAFLLLCFVNIGFAQTTVNYTTQMANFNTFHTEKNNMAPYAGTFNNGGTEIAQYANNGSFNNTPGAAAFQTFNTTGNGNTGTARTLKVGDRFTITAYVGANPSAGGRIGISFRNTTATTNFFSSTDANTVARFQIDDSGGWKIYHGGTVVQNAAATAGSDRALSIEITSSNTFNATIAGTTYYDLTFAATGPIAQFSIYTYGDNNQNSYWKDASLMNIGHEAGTGLRFGYGLTGGSQNISGVISNGTNTNATAGTLNNKVLVGGSNAYTIFSGSNSYAGTTTVNSNGRLELQNAQALGNPSNYVNVLNNATLSLYSPTGITYWNGLTTLNGNGQNGANGALRNVGGNNIWPGNIEFFAATRINADLSGSLALTGNINSSVLGPVTFGGTQPITASGQLQGNFQLAKDGSNTLTLTNENSYTGGTAIYEGRVQVSSAGNLGLGPISFPASAFVATLAATNSFTVSNSISVSSNKAALDVASGQALSISGTVSGLGRLTKSGAGSLNFLSGTNTSSGGLNIANGYVVTSDGNLLGTGAINLGLDANDVSQSNNVFLQNSGMTTFNQTLIVATNASGASRTVQSFGAPMTFSGPVMLNGTLTSSGSIAFTNAISGDGGLNITNNMTTLSGANTYVGNTTVNASSILFLGAANTMPDASNLILNGGTFNSGGVSDQMNLLLVETNSSISLGNGSHALTFANSSEEPWAGTLTIFGWNSWGGQSNTNGGRIFVGVGGLTAEQLAMITFDGRPGTPIILPSGELVPPGPMFAITDGATDHGSVCVGSPATTITYTITNTGGDAFDIFVGSDSAEFAVSNLSSATILSGGTATYDVTFTPAVSGTRNSIVTVSTTSPNGNTPIQSAITGFGIAPTTYYADADSDTYGDANGIPVITCDAAPEGYVTNNDDCDDDNNAIYPDASEICDGVDNDCDGLTDGDDPGLDLNSATAFYEDADDDGYGDEAASAVLACTAPAGYVDNNSDCDDANDAINPAAAEVCDGIDNDCDGLTDGADPSLDPGSGLTFYLDADLDGFGSDTSILTCVAPTGYVSNSDDCNDNNNQIYPSHAEVGYNLIDDDCDGLVDEGFPPKVTVVNTSQCGITLPAIDSQIVANIVAGAQGYRWRITNMNGPNAGQVQTLDTAVRAMKITQLVSYAFNTQYKVEVGVYYAGFLQPYNAVNCFVSTPEAMTSLTSCNQNLTSMSNSINANLVPYAAGYRFRITDPINALDTQVIERPIREFKMTQITNFAVRYGKTYNVEVSVKNTNGTWMSYSSPCQVTTPVFPTSYLQDSQCDNYAVPNNATQIYAISLPGAISYVFQLSGGGLPSPIEVTKGTRAFTLNDFAGQLTPGATYNVKVRVIFNVSDPVGPYGKTCTITTPGAARQSVATVAFNAIAHPSPFADGVNIDITTASDQDINIKAYDMMGRLLENINVKAGALIAPIGSQFPAGVYNIVVTQGQEAKTLRVIKR